MLSGFLWPIRFRCHLSTALVLMFAAAALIWANTRARPVRFALPEIVLDGVSAEERVNLYGWPVDCCKGRSEFVPVTKPRGDRVIIDPFADPMTWFFPGVAVDAVISLLILALVWRACEWRIERQANSQHVRSVLEKGDDPLAERLG